MRSAGSGIEVSPRAYPATAGLVNGQAFLDQRGNRERSDAEGGLARAQNYEPPSSKAVKGAYSGTG